MQYNPTPANVPDIADRAARILGTLRAPAATDLFNASNPGIITIGGATIAIPVDVQALYRTQIVLTTAVLAANATYNSASIDALNFRRITGRSIADVAGTVFSVQQSDDNVTWDNLFQSTPGVNTMNAFDVVIYLRYVRLQYINAATAQTAFRLSGYLAAA